MKDVDDINGIRVYILFVNVGLIWVFIDRGKLLNRWLKFYWFENLIIKNNDLLLNYEIF